MGSARIALSKLRVLNAARRRSRCHDHALAIKFDSDARSGAHNSVRSICLVLIVVCELCSFALHTRTYYTCMQRNFARMTQNHATLFRVNDERRARTRTYFALTYGSAGKSWPAIVYSIDRYPIRRFISMVEKNPSPLPYKMYASAKWFC